MISARPFVEAIAALPAGVRIGEVTASNGFLLQARVPQATVGELCEIISTPGRGAAIRAEVVGFQGKTALLATHARHEGLLAGARIRALGRVRELPVGAALLGRVVDAWGNPLDGGPSLTCDARFPLDRDAGNPLERRPIEHVLETGIRSIDALLTIGHGQRVGVFAGSGVGKSTLLGMLARNARADTIVLAMVGERGREVGEFIKYTLGAEGMRHTVVVAASSGEPALVRVRAAHAAHAVAEYFSMRGASVLLIMDSVTRYAMAQREIGLAAGEPPTSRGYPPSVFAKLPGLLERAGNFEGRGAISAIYSVLVEGDDFNDPVADSVRAILDGHIVLSRERADRGQFPAIDPLRSVSRLMSRLSQPSEREAVRAARQLLAAHERAHDLIAMGAYQSGHDPILDQAVAVMPQLEDWLRQREDEVTSRAQALNQLARLVDRPEEQR